MWPQMSSKRNVDEKDGVRGIVGGGEKKEKREVEVVIREGEEGKVTVELLAVRESQVGRKETDSRYGIVTPPSIIQGPLFWAGGTARCRG